MHATTAAAAAKALRFGGGRKRREGRRRSSNNSGSRDGRRRLALKKLRLCSFPLASLALRSAQGSTVGDWRSLQRNSGRRWVARCPSLPPSLRPSSHRREKKTPKRVFRHQRGKEEAPKVPSCSPRKGGEAAAATTTTLGGAVVVVVSAQECEDRRAERERGLVRLLKRHHRNGALW